MSNPKNFRVKHWRMIDWLAVAIVLAALVWLVAPQQLPVSLYKLSLVAMAAVAGYWIDRSLFPYARPDCFLAEEDPPDLHAADSSDAPAPECGNDDLCLLAAVSDAQPYMLAAAMLRRAVIVAATMLAVGLGA